MRIMTIPRQFLAVTAALALGTSVALTGVQPAQAAPTPTPSPSASAMTELAIPATLHTTSATGSTVVLAALPARDTAPFTMAGVTWTGDVTPTVQVRTKSGSTWSAWTAIERDDFRGTASSGTDPVFLGTNLTGIEVKVSGPEGLAVKDLKLTLINSDAIAAGEAANPDKAITSRVEKPTGTAPKATTTATATAAGTNADVTAYATRQPGRPAGIYTRAMWGADESLTDHACLEVADRLQGAMIHHTAGSNTYTAAQSAGVVRGILSYHTQTRGWCDIGYNILVDKYGQVFEGRYGSLDKNVKGVHAGPGNYRSVGISLMMNSETYAPGTVVYDKVARLVAWKLGQANVDPALYQARYLVNDAWITIGNVAGHRQVMPTACPGVNIWNNMGQIRSKAAAQVTVYSMTMKGLPTMPATNPLTVSGTVSPKLAGRTLTVTVKQGTTVLGTVTTTVGTTGAFSVTTWAGRTQAGQQTVTASVQPDAAPLLQATQTIFRGNDLGDQTSDHLADIFAVDTAGSLHLLETVAGGPSVDRGPVAGGWGDASSLTQIADLNGDAMSDVLSRRASDGSLWLYTSVGDGTLRQVRQVGSGWSGMDAIVPVGDLSGTGVQYLVARRATDGALFRYAMTAGTLADGVQIGSSWGGMKTLVSVGDFIGADGLSDILAVRNDGTLWAYAGKANGTVAEGTQVGLGWDRFDLAFSPGDMTADGRRDLVGRRDDGALFVYANLGGRWAPAAQVATDTLGLRLMG